MPQPQNQTLKKQQALSALLNEVSGIPTGILVDDAYEPSLIQTLSDLGRDKLTTMIVQKMRDPNATHFYQVSRLLFALSDTLPETERPGPAFTQRAIGMEQYLKANQLPLAENALRRACEMVGITLEF